ncbi:hypothetical protein GCM10009122_16080 [Fulvivirga kasyanovii]|uniref:PH domain-containing protein n=1 Tax=Fulvivirga kasyanovii TaxID=396812 RepID=A0ABW9RKD1_9BACT|nr:hypothetical protein [Fulvivirga kasyanovii]MTI24542.1 hypothetical protein [Fulvivirga kasyanovii]
MNGTLNLSRNLIIVATPLALFGTLIFLMKSPILSTINNFDLAITIDLVISVPFIYYLLIRKASVPNTTVVPVMVIGVVIGSHFLPEDSRLYLNHFKTWGLPVIELLVLAFIIFKVRQTVNRYTKLKTGEADFFTVLKALCYETFPKPLVMPMASEIAVMYYGLINWKTRKLGESDFSYHKNSGTTGLFGAAVLVIAIETFVLHSLLIGWSVVAAWALTILSIYTGMQFLGFARSLSKRPISIDNGRLYLRYGILNEVDLSVEDIEAIEFSRKSVKDDKEVSKLSPLGELEEHNVILHLSGTVTLTGIYGIKKRTQKIALYVDEPEAFKRKLEMEMKVKNEQ